MPWERVCLHFILSAKRKQLIWLPCGERMQMIWGSGKVAFPKFQNDARFLLVAWPAYTSPYFFMQKPGKSGVD